MNNRPGTCIENGFSQDLPSQSSSATAAMNVTVALNKADLLPSQSNIKPVVDDVKQLLQTAPHCSIDGIFLLCALPGRGEGVADLTRHLLSRATLQPWPHPKEMVSTSTLESVVVEMIRERLFYHIRQEVPYACRVVVNECQMCEDDDGCSAVAASASIVVKKSLHKVALQRISAACSHTLF